MAPRHGRDEEASPSRAAESSDGTPDLQPTRDPGTGDQPKASWQAPAHPAPPSVIGGTPEQSTGSHRTVPPTRSGGTVYGRLTPQSLPQQGAGQPAPPTSPRLSAPLPPGPGAAAAAPPPPAAAAPPPVAAAPAAARPAPPAAARPASPPRAAHTQAQAATAAPTQVAAPRAAAVPSVESRVVERTTATTRATATAQTTAQARARAAAQATAESAARAPAESAGQPGAALATVLRPPAPEAVETHRPDPVVTPRQPTPRRRSTALFGIHVGQVVAWQVVIIGVLFAIPQPLTILIPVALGGVVLLGLTAVRPRGRWLYEWAGLWLRYVSRRRRAAVPAGKDAVTALLGSVIRGGQLQTIEIEGARAALVVHAGGMTVLVETRPASRELIVDASPAIPPLTVLLPLGEEGEPVISAQIVISTVPAPGPLGPKSPAVLSYRSLGHGMVPAQRRSWIALQALRTADDHDDTALRAALSNAVSRLKRRLRKAGLRGLVLAEDRAVSDLLSLSRLDAPLGKGANATAPEIHESWYSWSTGRETQTAFRLLDWPDLASPAGPDFVDRLITVPTLSTTVSVAARRQGDEVELEAAVRLVLPDADAVESTTEEIATIATSYSARVQRLDGEQVFGVAASLPLGGFLP